LASMDEANDNQQIEHPCLPIVACNRRSEFRVSESHTSISDFESLSKTNFVTFPFVLSFLTF
jgi:hypothetical protein